MGESIRDDTMLLVARRRVERGDVDGKRALCICLKHTKEDAGSILITLYLPISVLFPFILCFELTLIGSLEW